LHKEKTELGFVHKFVKGQGNRTFLLLHGTGGDETDLLPVGEAIDPSASYLSPRGKILENGMPRFFRRFAEGVFDIEDLKFRTIELADFVVRASDAYEFDLRTLIALGYSNGANIAASLVLLRPEVLQAALLFRSMLPFEPDTKPELKGKKVLMSSGRFDPITPKDKVQALADLLSACGASVNLSWVNSSHALSEEDIIASKKWLASEFQKQ
jgi:phospholipase/carboxylesterase